MKQAYQRNKVHDELSMTYCRKLVFTILALAIILFSIYSNSFYCSWQFDDEPNITENPNLHLKKITPETIKDALFSNRNNRPVACITLALNYYFGGLDVFGYHLINIFIHLISSIFLFLFIYHTFFGP